MKLARINTVLVVAIIAVNFYIVVTPLAPAFLFWFNHNVAQKSRELTSSLHAPTSSTEPQSQENRLVVPVMALSVPIYEGRDMSALRKGIWRRPNTSTPDKGGNTVIAGHRFTYTNPRGTFYELNRVQVGDEIGVYWSGKRYLYTVTETKVVSANEVSVEAPTDQAQLTLYTCTPLWLPKDRLVVIAKPQQEQAP